MSVLKAMSESELRTEDSLQPVKYLGKVQSSYTHGIGVAIVSNIDSLHYLYTFNLNLSFKGIRTYRMETFEERFTLQSLCYFNTSSGFMFIRRNSQWNI